ncbi:MAG: sugar transferase [Coriobacteriia bacterium]
MRRGSFVALSVVLDAVLVNAGIVVAFVLRFAGRLPEFNFSAYVTAAPFITVAFAVSSYIFGLYEPERIESPWAVLSAVARAVTLGTVLTAAVSFFLGTFAFSRLVILLSWVFNMVLVAGWRLVALKLTPIRWPEQRVLIVGTGPTAVELARELDGRKQWGYSVCGFVSPNPDVAPEGAKAQGLPAPVLGSISDLERVVRQTDADRVIVTSPAANRETVEKVALGSDLRIDVVPEMYEIFIGQFDTVVADIPLLELTRGTSPSWFSAAKRAVDVALSSALLVLLSPVILGGMLAVLVTMGWPIFYTQERVGKNMERFSVIKLRTMVRDAERMTGPVLAEEDDPRITPVGRVLRRYRIDELPQLINILKGDMSFVGPRPERPEFVREFTEAIPGYAERFKVKPGATGLAQVSGSYATTPERKLKYDLIYMYHQSLLMDFQILIETIRVVLTGRGAR